MIDRETIRQRPGGMPIMHQRWSDLLFLHWAVPPELITGTLPPGLELDTWEGNAWLGLTPFAMSGVRPPFLPALPGVSQSYELNVRTYVHAEGVPGVWFYSLDASNPLAVAGARAAFHLPYHHARMSFEEEDGEVRFESTRTGDGPGAEFRARWRRGSALPAAAPGTRDYFLIERYCLYVVHEGRLRRSRIHHRPWPLRRAELVTLRSSMLTSQGLPAADGEPLLHAQAAPLDVEVWPLEQVGTG
jgi:uncharacterized protein